MDNVKIATVAVLGGVMVMITSCAKDKTALVGWWKFDQTTGAVAADSSGHGNHGTLENGPSWVPGRRGGALEFANTDETKVYVNIPNSPTLENIQEGDYTVATWV